MAFCNQLLFSCLSSIFFSLFLFSLVAYTVPRITRSGPLSPRKRISIGNFCSSVTRNHQQSSQERSLDQQQDEFHSGYWVHFCHKQLTRFPGMSMGRRTVVRKKKRKRKRKHVPRDYAFLVLLGRRVRHSIASPEISRRRAIGHKALARMFPQRSSLANSRLVDSAIIVS